MNVLFNFLFVVLVFLVAISQYKRIYLFRINGFYETGRENRFDKREHIEYGIAKQQRMINCIADAVEKWVVHHRRKTSNWLATRLFLQFSSCCECVCVCVSTVLLIPCVIDIVYMVFR